MFTLCGIRIHSKVFVKLLLQLAVADTLLVEEDDFIATNL